MAAQSVTDWLAALRDSDVLRCHLVEAVRQLALTAGPAVAEEIKYGGILFAGRRGFCGIFSYANHATLEFSEGASLADPAGLLEGKGKGRRHLKLTSIGDIEAKQVGAYIARAYAAAEASP